MTRCERKIRYRDELGAQIALSSINARLRKKNRNESRIYRCPGCNGWHLTSTPKNAELMLEDAPAREGTAI